MKELPIIFNTNDVRATLEGRKSRFTRLIKAKHGFFIANENSENDSPWPIDEKNDDWMKPPYKIGDRLYVRETFCYDAGRNSICYRDLARYDLNENKIYKNWYTDNRKWKPSIHMPKKFARIWLEITGVRVERNEENIWEWVYDFKVVFEAWG